MSKNKGADGPAIRSAKAVRFQVSSICLLPFHIIPLLDGKPSEDIHETLRTFATTRTAGMQDGKDAVDGGVGRQAGVQEAKRHFVPPFHDTAKKNEIRPP